MLVILLIHMYLYWGISDRIRVICAKLIFKKSGNIDVINRRVYFGNGTNIVIGHHSTLGAQVTRILSLIPQYKYI